MTFYGTDGSPLSALLEKDETLNAPIYWNTAKEGSLLWILWPDRKCIAGIFWGIFIVFKKTIFM